METWVTIKVSIVLHPQMDTKSRILEKSHELFNRFGIRSVSMDEIATQLGISKKTVYQYYKDKDELVNDVFSAVMDKNKEQCLLCHQQGENTIEEIFRSFDMVTDMLANIHPSVIFDLQKYHPGTFKKFQDYKNHFLFKIIKQNLETGVETGLYRDDIDIDILSRYRLQSILMAFDSEVFPTNKSQLVHIEQQLLEHFLYGISTTKGQKLVQKYKNQRTIK
jgi:AcrR family transcriptional regulator